MSRLCLYRPHLLALAALAYVGCASRQVPTHYPDDSPASPNARAALPATVTAAVDPEGDVPQPLPQEPAAKAHEGHHAHHH